jgi:hypothetical protein
MNKGECFQAEVEADAFTRSCLNWLDVLISRETEPEIAQRVAFNRESFNVTPYLS